MKPEIKELIGLLCFVVALLMPFAALFFANSLESAIAVMLAGLFPAMFGGSLLS